MTDVVIVGAARTPIGAFSGTLANTPAHDLGAIAIKAALERAGVEGDAVDEVILGQVLTGGQGQNPARQAAIGAGISDRTTAFLINQVCGSGLRTVALAAQQIMTGDANIVVAGGQENMSLSTHVAHLRAGHKMGDVKFIDSMIRMACGVRSTAITWATRLKTLPRNGASRAKSRMNSPLPLRTRPRPPRKPVASMMKSPR
jgi:acetyl-CoA C-acetyltransferase